MKIGYLDIHMDYFKQEQYRIVSKFMEKKYRVAKSLAVTLLKEIDHFIEGRQSQHLSSYEQEYLIAFKILQSSVRDNLKIIKSAKKSQELFDDLKFKLDFLDS